jgi:hypothetical protein
MASNSASPTPTMMIDRGRSDAETMAWNENEAFYDIVWQTKFRLKKSFQRHHVTYRILPDNKNKVFYDIMWHTKSTTDIMWQTKFRLKRKLSFLWHRVTNKISPEKKLKFSTGHNHLLEIRLLETGFLILFQPNP